MTRVETQARTRERLLDVAADAFASDGFGGASLERIAERAGLTRGAVYANFDGKADLFIAVLERQMRRRVAEVSAAMEAAADPGALLRAMRAPAWSSRSAAETRRQLLLYDEFRSYALRNPKAAKLLARLERRERDYYVEAAEHLLGQLGVALPSDPRLIGAILFALDQGLPRQHAIDPKDVSRDAFSDAIDLLLRAAVALGTG